MNAIIYHGDKKQRDEIRRKHMPRSIGSKFPIVITSYEIAMSDARKYLRPYSWKYLVVDEVSISMWQPQMVAPPWPIEIIYYFEICKVFIMSGPVKIWLYSWAASYCGFTTLVTPIHLSLHCILIRVIVLTLIFFLKGHRLKNSKCKLLRELKYLPVDNKLLLTGTPLQNNLAELWSMLNFILPDIFQSHEEFESWYVFH